MGSTIKNYGSHANAPINYRGETKSLVEWAQSLNLDYSVIRMRYKRGKVGDELFHPTPSKFTERAHNGTWRDLTKPSKTEARRANTPPSIFYELSPDTQELILRRCNGSHDEVVVLIEQALQDYLSS